MVTFKYDDGSEGMLSGPNDADVWPFDPKEASRRETR